MEKTSTISPLQRLSAKWQVLAIIALGFAKLLRRYEDGQRVGAYAQARQLQVIVRAAHIMLMQDIAEAAEDMEPRTEDDTHALARLRFIAVSLIVMHRVLENMLTRGLRGDALWQLCLRRYFTSADCAVPARPVYGAPLLDPG